MRLSKRFTAWAAVVAAVGTWPVVHQLGTGAHGAPPGATVVAGRAPGPAVTATSPARSLPSSSSGAASAGLGKAWKVRRHGTWPAQHPTPGPSTTAPPSSPGTTTRARTSATTTRPATTPSPATTAPQATIAPPPTTAAPATTSTVPRAPTTTTTVAASGTLNTLARIEYSMAGPHEGAPSGVPPSWSWGSHAEVVDPSDASGYTAMTGWGLVYADASASEPPQGTVRVELKNMESYVFSISQQKWLRVQGTVQVDGGHFLDDFSTNASIAADWRTEPDGGISSAMVPGYNLHFWPTGGRGAVVPGDVVAVYTTFQARVVGPSASSSRYLASAAGDWWLNSTAPFPDNGGIGEGRFMYLSTSWQAFDFFTGGVYGPSPYPPAWTDAQLAASRPPIDAMGLP